ncbi:MAG: hypothetical protein II721_06595 [Bacilli bacterium]|nr:hypothetical protein [Bacilli bacterium]
MKQDLLKGLTEEQIAKAKACKNHDELLELAKKEGVELTDEQLSAISGGGACSVVSDIGDKINPWDCPKCGANRPVKDGKKYTCEKCGYTWTDNSSPI